MHSVYPIPHTMFSICFCYTFCVTTDGSASETVGKILRILFKVTQKWMRIYRSFLFFLKSFWVFEAFLTILAEERQLLFILQILKKRRIYEENIQRPSKSRN